jgi:hypothetical protein
MTGRRSAEEQNLSDSSVTARRSGKGGERSGDDYLDRLVAVDKGPGCDRPVRTAQAQAGVLTQIVDALRPLTSAQIIEAANDDKRKRWRQPHRDHVSGDELAQPNAGVKPFGREVDQPLACGNLHLNLGIGLGEGCDQRLQQDRHHRARYREAQQPGWPLSEVTCDLACGDEFLEGGLRARKEPFAGFGQTTLRVVRMKSAAPTRASRARTA